MSARTICHVADYGGTSSGSFIPTMLSLSRALVARGDRFVVFATEVPGATWPADLKAAGVELRLIRSNRELIEGLRALQPEVVFTHYSRYDLPVLLGAPRARIFWHYDTHRENTSLFARIRAFIKYRVLGRRVEGIVTVSEAMRAECIAWFAPPGCVRMVYNGIDPGRFRFPTPEERSSARARFGIAPSDRVVLFFERRPYKGGATLRRAFAKLPEHRLLVLGGSEAARDLFGTQPRVIASARIADARQAYWAADALAFPSEIEAFGVVLIEALACGLPIAASDIPVVHEICDGVESVFIYPTGDAQALADALERASSCTSIESGRARVIERFSLEGWTRDVLALYDGG